jgi:hypothetical protein
MTQEVCLSVGRNLKKSLCSTKVKVSQQHILIKYIDEWKSYSISSISTYVQNALIENYWEVKNEGESKY